jgi:hypothetical protein
MYLSLVVFVGLIIVGTANFTPSANLVTQKKQITLSLYEFARISLLFVLAFYILNIVTLNTTLITFNSYAITDIYTQVLKVVVILTT